MKLVNFYRKPISMLVMVTFTILLCFWANQTPAASTAPASEKSQAAALENSKAESANFVEKEEPAPAIKKGKKFPWLIVALVAVAGGAALYFLVLNKKYTLTVTVGEGVTGTPAAGTSSNKKGTAIAYSYSLQSGYSNLSVTLDGAAVAASGTVTMDANHTLAASASKTYVLTVSRGEHVNGTPASGTYNYASGTNVNYSYAPASGYSNLEVKLDSVTTAATGTIAMNANHILAANLYGANIEVNSTPAGALIYLDNVKSGFITPHSFFFATAVTKTVLLRYNCGYKDYTKTISASLGQTKTINATMAAGIHEDFNAPASYCWKPYYTSSWSTGGGVYKYKGAAPKYSLNFYEAGFTGIPGNYTVTVKMNRKSGGTWATGIFLGMGDDVNDASGYFFTYYPYSPTGSYGVICMNPYDFIGSLANSIAIIKMDTSSAINTGLNKWNTLKIVKVGTHYTYYINNVVMHSFTDDRAYPSMCGLASYNGGMLTEMYYEYVYLNPTSGAGSIPGRPMKITPEMEKENLKWDPATGERKD